jgi:tight adherence protein C
MLDIVTVAAFALIACLAWLFARTIFGFQQGPSPRRLAAAGPPEIRGPASLGGRLVESLAGQLPQAPFDHGELARDLRRAGCYRPGARSEFLAMRNAWAILAVVLPGILGVAIGPTRQGLVVETIIGGLAVAAVLWSQPRVLLAVRGRRRVERIRNALPNAMDMVSMCVAGGLPLHDALAHVGREIADAHPDLAVELAIIRQQTDLSSLSYAFQQFAERIDIEETAALASLVAQNQRLGIGAVDAICEYADSIRLKRRHLADELAGKAQWRLLFPVVLCLVPSVLILLWGPGILEMWKFFQSLAAPMTPAP